MNKQSENGNVAIAVALILGIVVIGMYLVGHNGNDPFTAMWAFLATIH